MPRKVVKNRAGGTWTDDLYQELHDTFKLVDYNHLVRRKGVKGATKGSKAGSKIPSGYLLVNWNGFEKHGLCKAQYEHRVIYFMYYKELPSMLDHIDGNRSNNHVLNLRPTNDRLNQLNRHKKGGVDTDLPIGVYRTYRKGRDGIWYAINYKNGDIRKSTFRRDRDEAINLIADWRKMYG